MLLPPYAVSTQPGLKSSGKKTAIDRIKDMLFLFFAVFANE
jgi:hypothetical protein